MINLKLGLYAFLSIVFVSLLAVFKLTKVKNTKLNSQVVTLKHNNDVQKIAHEMTVAVKQIESKYQALNELKEEPEQELTIEQLEVIRKIQEGIDEKYSISRI